jgi:hypothetical protein
MVKEVEEGQHSTVLLALASKMKVAMVAARKEMGHPLVAVVEQRG